MRTIVIPAAGLASRMKPLSKGVSKAMIPVNGRPLISYIIEHIEKSKAKATEYIIIENELGDISEFLKRVYPSLPFVFVQQVDKLGPLHAINLGVSQSKQSGPVTVWLGDTICLDNFQFDEDFLAVHKVSDKHRWCLVDKNGNLYDKPDSEVTTNRALIGVYNFQDRVRFDNALGKGMLEPTHKGEHQIAALLTNYMKQTGIPMSLIDTNEWYDCGELNSYYESKARLLKNTARSFNKMDVDTFYGTITKTTDNLSKHEKINDEKHWFNSLTQTQALFCPRILDSKDGVLSMSLEPGVALNEVLVYDNLRTEAWHDIIKKILKVHHDVFYNINNNKDAELYCFSNYYQRNKERIEEIFKTVTTTKEQQDIIKTFFEGVSLELCKNPKWSLVIHGDSHLGNIIYDPHNGNIKFVDPRGSFGGLKGTQGDIRYDMGKLLQDFYCGYSMILAGKYKIVNDILEIEWVSNTSKLTEFLESELDKYGYDTSLLKNLSILLLLTAIPFHSDDRIRQQAFLTRCINLITNGNIPRP